MKKRQHNHRYIKHVSKGKDKSYVEMKICKCKELLYVRGYDSTGEFLFHIGYFFE